MPEKRDCLFYLLVNINLEMIKHEESSIELKNKDTLITMLDKTPAKRVLFLI